ncbi:MAG TPA: tripartite tricarboxylate transporter substrate-binding protein [Xanthobacteraceae bacterium]|nr:tripartite tricarboxylate transporter substrate-binding protein [Xanthobacteraceae bacterium]
MTALLRTIALIASLAGIGGAGAQEFPGRPITMIVPFPPGGAVDPVARILAERMKVALGQSIVVENVASGGNGILGVGRVARATPDGTTIGFGNWSTNVVNGAIYPLPYDLLSDLEPIAEVATTPQVIVSRKGLPAQTLSELIAWLKAHPGEASLGTVGNGSATHIAGLFFQKLTDTHVLLVPYRGAAQAMQDILAGQLDLMMPQATLALPQARAGTIRAYAVMAKTRLASAPEIPTVDEGGAPGLYLSTWSGLWAPKGTPPAVIARFEAAAREALADPAVRDHLGQLGQDVPPPDQQTPRGLGKLQRAEIDKWWPIIKAAGIKGE